MSFVGVFQGLLKGSGSSGIIRHSENCKNGFLVQETVACEIILTFCIYDTNYDNILEDIAFRDRVYEIEEKIFLVEKSPQFASNQSCMMFSDKQPNGSFLIL